MDDISNREVKDVIETASANSVAQNEAFKVFVSQANSNITKLNDNQIFHNNELKKLNENIAFWGTLFNKYMPKMFWAFGILIAIILVMAGYNFLWKAMIPA